MLRTAILLNLCLLTTGCAIQCREATFHRYEAIPPLVDMTATALMGGGVRLESKTGLHLSLMNCRQAEKKKNADLCLEIRLPEGRRFQFLETHFSVLSLDESPKTTVRLEPITYQTYCSIQRPSKWASLSSAEPVSHENTCPKEKPAVKGAFQEKEREIALQGKTVGIVRQYSFDPALEFEGESVDTNSVHKEMHWRGYNTIAIRDLQLGDDFILVFPPIAIDGTAQILPRIQVKTVNDKLCFVSELM